LAARIAKAHYDVEGYGGWDRINCYSRPCMIYRAIEMVSTPYHSPKQGSFMTSSCQETKRRLFLNQGLFALVGTSMTNSALSAMLQERPVLRLGWQRALHHIGRHD
jgi:hypothetical protein